MIGRDEIEYQATQMGVHHANVERDYVFGWLLKSFYENPYLASTLIFKGGNCMRKAFFPSTRFSGDLDFSVESAVDFSRMQTEINEACKMAQLACGVSFDTEKNTLKPDVELDKERKCYKGRIYFHDFYGNSDSVLISIKLDIAEFERLYLPTVTRKLIHPYSDSSTCQAELRCVALEEMIANKLKCLIQRRHSFDLYDLVYATFFEKSMEVDRSSVLSTFLRKTIFNSSPGAAKEILLGLPMPFFKGAWEKYVAPLAGRFDFDSAEQGFSSAIEAIFEGVQQTYRGAAAFYPAELRNVILEAGGSRSLLALTYEDGSERVVEPYALSYKRRADGQASEYFYVWDRTGGSSGPGVKTFLHTKIRALRRLDETFEPRYPMELSKSGERAPKDYFGKEFSQREARPRRVKSNFLRPARPAKVRSFGATYKVECPFCQKRFTRERADTSLNPHKDSNGWPCRGRRGYLV